MNKVNQAIVQCLKRNARMSWQQIGKQVFLTGQAVAVRVAQMEAAGVISGYTVVQQVERHFITVFMHNAHFAEVEALFAANPLVESAYKVAGDGCYHVVFTPDSAADLDAFLVQLQAFGVYKVASVIRAVKTQADVTHFTDKDLM
jgi:Lrp/AsnC family leucine-responsive transcriptional regulator